MKTLILISLAALCAPARAQEQVPAQSAEIRQAYDKAFSSYVAGDYQKAIEQWSQILRSDPKQLTAKNMIEDARRKMAGTSASLKNSFGKLLERGRYSEALAKLEELLATDPTNPYYLKVQGRLRRVAGLAPRRGQSKAWNAAAEGVLAWLGEKEDPQFAYDALRYAAELAPEKVFARLTLALEEEFPQLKLNDTKPENVGVLDHKKELALHDIYDSKFYLAVKELEGVLRLEPSDVTALKRAGSAYVQLKDYRQARQAWQRALELSPDDEQLKEYLQALDQASPPKRAPRGGREE